MADIKVLMEPQTNTNCKTAQNVRVLQISFIYFKAYLLICFCKFQLFPFTPRGENISGPQTQTVNW